MSDTPKTVNEINANEMYTASLTFRSIGAGNEVVPEFNYSHRFADEYDGDYPASYLLMRDIALVLSTMMTIHANTEHDLDELSPDEIAEAAIEAANRNSDPTLN